MIKNFHLFLIAALILSVRATVAQQSFVEKRLPIINVQEHETISFNREDINKVIPQPLHIPDLITGDVVFSFHPTDYFTGYDFQTNTVPREIWQDPDNPAYVHSVMIYSGQAGGTYSDRTCTYFLSTDYGNTWTDITNVPATGEKSGYPSIAGMPDGRQVITDHDNAGGEPTRTKIYIADAPGSPDFTSYDPGAVSGLGSIWSRFCVVSDDNILIVSSPTQSPSDNAFTINLNPITGVFSDWVPYEGTQYECYSLAVSEDGSRTGHLYIANESNFGDLFYRESSDGGYTWDTPVKIWDWNDVDSLGCLRSLDLIFLNNQPCAVFGVDKFGDGSYYLSYPSKIYFWSPAVNNGTPFPIAESGDNVPYFIQYASSNDLFTPVCRPSIGRSSSGQSLFVAFSSVTGNVYGDTTEFANSYFAGYLTYSTNAGQEWTQPVKFTPDSPLRDWRYVSVSPTNNVSGEDCTVQMFIQSDTAAGSNVNAPSILPFSVTAQMVGVQAEIQGIITGQQTDNNEIPDQFGLYQNYPNPFNPSTKIKYTVSVKGNVSIKVFDVLGNEVSELVNTEKGAGEYETVFNAGDLSSGLYFYQMKAGKYISTKKMLLLK